MFHRVLVLLDSLGVSRDALVHASFWAKRSGAPLIAMHGRPTEVLGPGELLVGGPSAATWSSQIWGKGVVLICPEAPVAVRRVLVVNAPGHSKPCYLQVAAEACRAIRAGMVVLSMGASERDAERRRRQAQASLMSVDVPVDFDVFAGTHSALSSIARLRQCQMVVTQRGSHSFWRRWLGIEDERGLEPAAAHLQMLLPSGIALPLSGDVRRHPESAGNGPTPVVSSSTGGLHPPLAADPPPHGETNQEVASECG